MKKSKHYIYWLCLLVIYIMTCAAYFNVLNGEFQFDDYVTITNNLNIKNIKNFADFNLFTGFFSGGRPVTDFTFALNYYFGKLNPRGYHLVSLFFHLLVIVTLLFFARGIYNAVRPQEPVKEWFFSLIAVSIFALHPVNTEAVSYISQRSEVLSTLLFLLSMLIFIKSLKQTELIYKTVYYAGGIILFIFALGSKLTAISLLLILFIYDDYFTEHKPFFKRLKFYLPIIIGTLTVIVLFLSNVSGSRDIGFSIKKTDSFQYLLTQFRVISTYIRLLIYPVNQNLDYEYTISKTIFEWDTILSIGLIAVMITAALILRKKERIASFGILWFFITLTPTSSFIPVIDVIFEHRVYLPSIGFSIFASYVIILVFEKIKSKYDKKLLVSVGAGIVLLLLFTLAFATINRNKVWKSRIALWRDVTIKSPNKPRAYMNLGQSLSEKGFYNDSVNYLVKALNCPDDGSVTKQEIFRELGVSLYKMGNLDDAISADKEGLIYAPDDFALLNNLSIAFMDRGDMKQSEHFAKLSLTVNPRSGDANNTMGSIYFKKGEYSNAIFYFLKAIELNPDMPSRYMNAALTFENLGDFDKANDYYLQYINMDIDEASKKSAMLHINKIKSVLHP